MTVAIKSALVASAFLLTAAAAKATVVEYSSLASFDAATTDQVTNGFNGDVADNRPEPLGEPGSYTVGDVTLDADAGSTTFLIGADAGFGNYGAAFFSAQLFTPETVTFTFATPVDAFAFDYGSYYSENDSLVLTLSTGDTIDLALPATTSTAAFIGVTLNADITSASLEDTASGPELDIIDVTTANANRSPVPEPGSLLLFGAGLVGLGLVRRRKRKPA